MRRKRRLFDRESENFWPAFTDMISTIALILFFLMLLAYISNIITGKNLDYARKQLEDTERRLEASKAEISTAEDQLRLMQNELEKTAAEVKRGEIALKISQDEIEEQRDIIAESNRELGQLRQKIEGIAVLRLDVLTSVKEAIEANLGTTNSQGEELVLIADNGNIIINEGLVFDRDSYTVKEEGKALLDQLALAFEEVLDKADVRENIDAIAIQGHTDERGSGSYNRDLSARRSTSVLNYLMQSNGSLENRYGRYFTASAYSEYRPIDDRSNEAAYAKNRRIEISVILRDQNIRNVLETYLDESLDRFQGDDND